jgi:uncharacterized protein YjbI with pentapeptide repeats
MTQKDVVNALQQHKAWTQNQQAGKRADFRGASLRHVDLTGADLRYADFRAADLSHANLSQADCQGTDFREANLANAVCVGTRFRGARFEGANLIGVDLRTADLEQAQMKAINGGRFQQILKGANPPERKPEEKEKQSDRGREL